MPPKKLPSMRGRALMVLGLLMALLLLAAVESVNLTSNYALTKQNEENRRHYMQVAGNFQTHAGALRTLMTSLSLESSVQQVMISRRLYGTSEGWDNFLITLFSYSRLEAGIDSAVVVDAQGQMYNYLYYKERDAFQKAIDYARAHDGYSPCFTLEGRRMYTISQPIYRLSIAKYFENRLAKGAEIGKCVFIMDLGQTQNQLDWYSEAGSHVMCILDAEGNVITQNQALPEPMRRYVSARYPMPEDGGEEHIDQVSQGGKRYAVYSNRLGESGWTLVCFSSTDIWSGETSVILVRMIATWLVVILLTLLLTTYLFQNIYGFVAHMQKHMKLVRDGNMDQKMPVWKKQEFANVSDGFNEMMERIISLTRQNFEIQTALYREELDKKQVALVALQSQVNPHFLYNTLECIKSIGLCHDAMEIPVICESLAQLMRYSIKGGALSTLSDELTSARSYLSIQNIRFDNRYQLHVNVPEDLLGAGMLKMVLQPLMENAILHGFGLKAGPGAIWIEAGETGDGRFRVSVRDDGCGMEEGELAALKELLSSAEVGVQSSASIGLPNVAQRLRLYYGDKGSLSIQSAPWRGTTVEIVMPLTFDRAAEGAGRKEGGADV